MDSIALLERLLEHYSPTGEEELAAAFLSKEMEKSGFTSRVDEVGNVIGTRGRGEREILLLGHIDTVSGKIDIRSEDDLLYGRGSVDAKGALACFTSAVSRINPPSGWRVTVIGAVGEEGDSRGAKHLCKNHNIPEMVIIGEPSGWDRITLGYKGSTWFQYTAQCATSHSAAGTHNACEQAAHFWLSLRKMAENWNTPHSRQFEQISPTLWKMNSTTDSLFDTATLNFNLRIPPDVLEPQLRNMLASITNGGKLEFDEFIPAYRAEKNTSLVRAFLASIRKFEGQPAFSLKTGTSDMNLVIPVWKCPVVAYGPGDSNLDHTPQEHISKSEYLKSIEILVDVLENIMKLENESICLKKDDKEKKPDGNLVSRVIPG
jgi:[amino group carrier protein]-lysine/ornithine hydrolase